MSPRDVCFRLGSAGRAQSFTTRSASPAATRQELSSPPASSYLGSCCHCWPSDPQAVGSSIAHSGVGLPPPSLWFPLSFCSARGKWHDLCREGPVSLETALSCDVWPLFPPRLCACQESMLPAAAEGSKDASPKLAVPQSALILVWAASGVVTASGRMLADAHWLSDTLAGALLGAFLVSAGESSPPAAFARPLAGKPCTWTNTHLPETEA